MPKTELLTDDYGIVRLWFWCPGCDEPHAPVVQTPEWMRPGSEPVWTWNGDLDKPTISPSVLARANRLTDGETKKTVCHSFLRDGKLEFLGDCTHDLAGQTVELPPLWEDPNEVNWEE